MKRFVIVGLLALCLTSCASHIDWVSRTVAGQDCRVDKLDAAGRCTSTR